MTIEDKSHITHFPLQLLWNNSQDLVIRTVKIPFIRKLIDSSLSDDVFSLCGQQDRYFEHIVRPYRKFIQLRDGRFSADGGIKILSDQKESAMGLGIVPTTTTESYIDFIVLNAGDLSVAA
ncbi:hypothetical protein HY041_03760, partial [Candidatus Roizmanbacteria bacterium]|nr:hypothetical protein [Candidatus Roizmanbacteria bacterium]